MNILGHLKSTKRAIGTSLVLLVVTLPLLVVASSTNEDGLYEFEPDTLISSGEVNDNFARVMEMIQNISATIADLVSASPPTGTIVAFAGPISSPQSDELPQGWALCDGASVPRQGDYAALFAVTNVSHGAVDADHFNLPDLRGVFLRGTDRGKHVDPDIDLRVAPQPGQFVEGNTGDAVGSYQEDQMQSHKHDDKGHHHSYKNNDDDKQVDSPNADTVADNEEYQHDTSTGYADLTDPTDSLTGAGAPRHGMETRPQNVYVNYIVKYR